MSSLSYNDLLKLAMTLLPSNDPTLNSPVEGLALLIHAIQSSTGFKLVRSSITATTTPRGSASESREATGNELDANWKGSGFTYKHDQSSLEFEIKVVGVGGRGLIVGVAVQDNKSATFDVLLSDYFSTSAFPFTCPPESSEIEAVEEGSIPNPLLHLFIHSTRLTDLISLYRLNVLQKLIPGLRKEGYTELLASTATTSGGVGASGSGQQGNLGRAEGPYYPDRGGPMGIPMPARGGGIPAYFNPPSGDGPIPAPPPGFNEINNPFNIGRSDLDPLGGGHFQGFPGSQGPAFGGLPGSTIGGGGMMVGLDHPMFRDRFGADPMGGDDMRNGIGGLGEGMRNGRGNNGVYGGTHPQGARYDPIGPGIGELPGMGRMPRPGQGGSMGIGRGGFGNGRGGGGGYNAGGNFGNFGRMRQGEEWDEAAPSGDHSDYDQMFS